MAEGEGEGLVVGEARESVTYTCRSRPPVPQHFGRPIPESIAEQAREDSADGAGDHSRDDHGVRVQEEREPQDAKEDEAASEADGVLHCVGARRAWRHDRGTTNSSRNYPSLPCSAPAQAPSFRPQ